MLMDIDMVSSLKHLNWSQQTTFLMYYRYWRYSMYMWTLVLQTVKLLSDIVTALLSMWIYLAILICYNSKALKERTCSMSGIHIRSYRVFFGKRWNNVTKNPTRAVYIRLLYITWLNYLCSIIGTKKYIFVTIINAARL